jgi:hypothetical protein
VVVDGVARVALVAGRHPGAGNRRAGSGGGTPVGAQTRPGSAPRSDAPSPTHWPAGSRRSPGDLPEANGGASPTRLASSATNARGRATAEMGSTRPSSALSGRFAQRVGRRGPVVASNNATGSGSAAIGRGGRSDVTSSSLRTPSPRNTGRGPRPRAGSRGQRRSARRPAWAAAPVAVAAGPSTEPLRQAAARSAGETPRRPPTGRRGGTLEPVTANSLTPRAGLRASQDPSRGGAAECHRRSSKSTRSSRCSTTIRHLATRREA